MFRFVFEPQLVTHARSYPLWSVETIPATLPSIPPQTQPSPHPFFPFKMRKHNKKAAGRHIPPSSAIPRCRHQLSIPDAIFAPQRRRCAAPTLITQYIVFPRAAQNFRLFSRRKGPPAGTPHHQLECSVTVGSPHQRRCAAPTKITTTSERHNTSDMEAEARHENLIFERPVIFIAAPSFHHLDVQNFRLIDFNVQHQSLRKFPQDNTTFAATTRLICKGTPASKFDFWASRKLRCNTGTYIIPPAAIPVDV
ncbi:hypothetical protein C8R43DRAFT_941098 [Mycena crocata]|nr:hypothetical protein C8R43DRAFT_941098 [Mycena crocata]